MNRPLIINFYDQKTGDDVRVFFSDKAYTDRAIALVNMIIKRYTKLSNENKKSGIGNIISALVKNGSTFYVKEGSKMAPLYIEKLKKLCGTAKDFCYSSEDESHGLISVVETDNFEIGARTSNRINLVVNCDGSIYCNYFNIMESYNITEFFEKYLNSNQEKIDKFHEIAEKANEDNIQETVHALNEMYIGVTDYNNFLVNYGPGEPLCYRDRSISNLDTFETVQFTYSVNRYSDVFDLWYVSLNDILDHLSDDQINVHCLFV